MILPPWGPEPGPRSAPSPLNLRDVKVSPAEAVATSINGSGHQVTSVTLVGLLDDPVYRIVTRGRMHLVDARTGTRLEITPALAERLVRTQFGAEGRVVDVGLVQRNSITYPWGPVPAYRIVFDSASVVAYYVSTRDGTVHRTDLWNWLRGAIIGLHTFEPLKLVSRSESLRTVLLLAFGLLSLAVVASGYYLALRR